MARNKYKGRAYIVLAVLLIAMAVILVTVLPPKKPPVRRPARPPSKAGARPPARTVTPPAQKVPRESPPSAPRESPQTVPARKPERKRAHPARIAVIIDDVGYASDNIDEYLRFEGKLTFSVLPFVEHSEAYARVLHEAGFEILIHVPMEPARYPSVNPGPRALLLGEPRQAVERKVLSMIEENPYAVGANNHMGSRATQDCELMGWVMSVLKEKNLFFVDSRTTGRSCAYEIALRQYLPAARRDVFLDNTDSVESITGQFARLKRIARSNGTAIGIGHVNKKHTLEVLMSEVPLLERENIALVFASEAVNGR
jgi:polysaccharide deacetylase 2 family uncharacterized protein YibQ